MRLATLALAALLAMPGYAVANHQDGAQYNGTVTTGEGGTVELNVSEDGSQVEADFQGLGNANNSCFGVGFGTGAVPITGHSFSHSANGGQVTANGTFGPSFAAGGAQVLTNPCTTGSQGWIVDGPDAFFGTSLGQSVLNDTGADQTLQLKAKPGESELFELRFENVGVTTETYRIKGCKSSEGFKVAFTDGADISSAVASGDYETVSLMPSQSQGLVLQIKAKKSAKKGKTKTCKVEQNSELFVDVVKAKLKVGRG